MFTSHHDQQDESVETTERLRFVSGWFRVLGFVLMLPFSVGGRVLRRLARRIFRGGAEILYDR